MNCSTCNNPMFVILCDRAFCEKCYETLQEQQRQLIKKFPNGAVIDQITPGWWKDK